MNKITIIAIDRAEAEIGRACKKFAQAKDLDVRAVMLVNDSFRDSPAYRGDETGGYFEEINCDFDDIVQLKKILDELSTEEVAFHCRMEEAIKDYAKIVPLVSDALVPTVDALINSTEKYEMRKSISARYLEVCPKFSVLTDASQFDATAFADFSFPVIVKPNGLHSSFFVTKCYTLRELQTCIEVTFKNLAGVYEREYGTGDPSLLVEEFMVGDMYSIDAYVDAHGKVTCLPLVRVVTAAELGLDGYYSYRHIVPTGLGTDDAQAANMCTEKAIAALGLTSSVAHTELYKTADGWKIIELGPRIGGYRQDLYMQAFGIDHYYNDLLIHYGDEPDVTVRWNRHAAGLNIYAESEGIISSIYGLDKARKIKSVVYLSANAKVGDIAKFASNGGQYIVDGILANKDPEQLERDVQSVRSLINIRVMESAAILTEQSA